MKLKNKAQIEAWLEKGELDEVISDLKKQLKASKSGKALYSDALVLSAQLKKINTDKIQRVLSYEQESLTLNNYRRSLVDFISMIESHEGEPEAEEAPVAKPQKTAETSKKKGGAWWWWLLLPLAAVGIWILASKEKAKVNIQICTLTTMSVRGHCCNQDLSRISLYESNGVFYATFPMIDDYGLDPSIQGMVFWESGQNFPVKPIKFDFDITQGDLCYSTLIQPINGIEWQLGKFTFQLQLNGEVAGEKTFEIIR